MTRNRFFYYIVACTLVFGLTGCGSKYAAATPAPASDTETETSTEEFEPFDGEGAVQGGIKSDEEIAALQEEEQQYTAEAASEEEPAEFADNTGHEPSTYIGAENFWQGDDYFDLKNYLYMNGASIVQKGYYDDSWTFQESDDNIKVYKAQFSNPYWNVTIQLPVSIEFRYNGYLLDGVPVLHPVYLATQSTPVENQKAITINNVCSVMNDTVIQTLDKMMSLTKEHPDDDNPFQYNDRNDLFGVAVSSEDIPAGATKR